VEGKKLRSNRLVQQKKHKEKRPGGNAARGVPLEQRTSRVAARKGCSKKHREEGVIQWDVDKKNIPKARMDRPRKSKRDAEKVVAFHVCQLRGTLETFPDR